jgi:uncharacterized protein (TIGR02246 family)
MSGRALGLVSVGALSVAWLGSAPQVEGQAFDAERQAIRKVLDDQEKAWNGGDLEGFLAGYWRSPDLSFFSGKDHTRGWRQTLERYRKRYQAEGKQMGRLAFAAVDIDVLGKDAAWVRGRWGLTQGAEKHGGLFTLILRRFPEGWRIVHDHTSGE